MTSEIVGLWRSRITSIHCVGLYRCGLFRKNRTCGCPSEKVSFSIKRLIRMALEGPRLVVIVVACYAASILQEQLLFASLSANDSLDESYNVHIFLPPSSLIQDWLVASRTQGVCILAATSRPSFSFLMQLYGLSFLEGLGVELGYRHREEGVLAKPLGIVDSLGNF